MPVPPRVLVVDDDPILRELMLEMFAGLGFTALPTENGEEACAVLDRESLDLAVIDLNMPKLDGFGLLSHIRRHPAMASLPVIVATSSGDKDSIERAYQLGASSFVTKPINWAQFAHHAQFVVRNGRTERDLRLAQAEAAAAARLKNGLFSVLGHELKTPVTAMIGLTDVLAKTLGTRLQNLEAEHLGHVIDAAHRLNQIVSDILILSRALSGPARLEPGAYAPQELLEESLAGFRTKASLLGIRLRVVEAGHLPALRCDGTLVRQALRRLIDNALKFSPAGGEVTLWAEAGGGMMHFSVRDDGPGISMARLRECLEPFVQGDMSYSRPAEGLGLGLPIAHTIAEAHGGELAVTTTPGNGLQATLKLPLSESSALAA
jgi:signal transduction histidine kinase